MMIVYASLHRCAKQFTLSIPFPATLIYGISYLESVVASVIEILECS